MPEFKHARFAKDGYEVSSAGDRRYSAMFARLKDGRTIEEAYQQAKGSGKGRPAKAKNFDYYGTYKGLWEKWADENPDLIEELRIKASGRTLTDKFANTSNNQARALSDILNSRTAGNMPEKRNIVSTSINKRAAAARKKERYKKQGKGFEDELTGKVFGKPVKKQYPLRNQLGNRILEDLIGIGEDPEDALKLVRELGDIDDLDPHTRLKIYMSRTTLPVPKSLIDDALGQPGPGQSVAQMMEGQSYVKDMETARLKERQTILKELDGTGRLAYRQQAELQDITEKLDEVEMVDKGDIKEARRRNRLDQELIDSSERLDNARPGTSSPYMGPQKEEILDDTPSSKDPLKNTPQSRFHAVRRGSTLVVDQGPNVFVVRPDPSGKGLEISRQYFNAKKDFQGRTIPTAGSYRQDLVPLTQDQKSNFIKALATQQIEETDDVRRKAAIKAAISTKAKRVAAFERLESTGKPFGTLSPGIRAAGMRAVATGKLGTMDEPVESVRLGGRPATPRDLNRVAEKNIGRGGNFRKTKADMMRAARALSRKGGPAALIALAVLLGGGAMVGGSSDSA